MRRILLYIFLINCIILNAQSLDNLQFSTGSDGPSPYINFKNNTVSLLYPRKITISGKDYWDVIDIENKKYSYSTVNGIYRITVYSDPIIELYLLFNDEFGYFSVISPHECDSGILLRITDEIIPRLPRGGGEAWLYEILFNNFTIKTSSFLMEDKIEYIGSNLNYLFSTKPWVEGKSDAGIGEYLELDYSENYFKETDTIVISNGFFSPNNPDLYFQNNRIKRIRIEDMGGDYKQEFNVLDTPNLQTFKLNGFYTRIRIIILDVYYGYKYNDTCINYLVGIKYLLSP